MPFMFNVGTPVTYSNTGRKFMLSAPGYKGEQRYPATVTSMRPEIKIKFEGSRYPQGSNTMTFPNIFTAENALSKRNEGGKRKSKKTRKAFRKTRKATQTRRR